MVVWCCYSRERTVIMSVLNEEDLRKRKCLAAFRSLCCPERWSGMNRICHPDWVKICVDPKGRIKLRAKQKYEILSATQLMLLSQQEFNWDVIDSRTFTFGYSSSQSQRFNICISKAMGTLNGAMHLQNKNRTPHCLFGWFSASRVEMHESQMVPPGKSKTKTKSWIKS